MPTGAQAPISIVLNAYLRLSFSPVFTFNGFKDRKKKRNQQIFAPFFAVVSLIYANFASETRHNGHTTPFIRQTKKRHKHETITHLHDLLVGIPRHPCHPVAQLLERIDKGASKKIKTELVKQDKDFFEIDQASASSPIIVRGNTWVNIATGINWYLKYYAGIHLTWNNMTAKLPATMPRVEKKERHETDLKLRYDFNYCTFSYSMAFWDSNRWQKEIDWMALHGVNMPLAAVGEECVWRNMLLKLGYTEEEIGKFIAGPAFMAWWAMNNLEGWGGRCPSPGTSSRRRSRRRYSPACGNGACTPYCRATAA